MAEEYARAIARVIVAQMASTYEFEVIQDSALDTLADVLMKYIREVGALTHDNCEHANRNQPNLNDLVPALAQMGASVHDLIDYNEKEDEIPFAAPITEFPVVRPRRSPPSFADRNEQPPAYIPPHLPAFPDAHTHRATAVLPGAPKDAAQKRAAIVKAKRSAEQSLARQARAIQPSDTAGQNLLAADLRWEDAAQDTARRAAADAAGTSADKGGAEGKKKVTVSELFRGLLERIGDGTGGRDGEGVAAGDGKGAVTEDDAMEVDEDGGGGDSKGLWVSVGQQGDVPLREKLSFALDLEATMAKRSKASTGGLPRAPLQHFQGKTEVDEEVARMFEESRSLVQQMD